MFAVRRRYRYRPVSRIKLYFFTLIFFFLFSVFSLVAIEKKLEPTLLVIAKQKSEQLAKEAIADSVSKKITELNISFKDVIKMDKDNEGKIRGLNLEFKEYSRFIAETNQRIKNRLHEYEEDKVNTKIPIGLATGSPFFAELGPSLPVTFVPIGNVKTKLDTKLTDAGINMVMVSVIVHVEVNLQIIIPFASDVITVVTDLPVSTSLVIGDVPNYWYNNPEGKPDVPLNIK